METKHKITRILTRNCTKVLVFISFVFVFFSVLPLTAEAATLFFSPNSGTYTVSRNFTVSVKVSTDQAMNAAEGVINFPTDKLQVVGVSKTGSIFNLWVQEPSYSNSGSTGNVRFEGVVLNPGYTGNNGKILEITFQAKGEGLANVEFASGSVLANDGQGTNILASLGSAAFTIQKGTIVPDVVAPGSLPPRPSIKHFIKDADGQEVLYNLSENGLKWSNSSYGKLVWIVPSQVNGVTTLFNDSPDSNPGTKSEGLFDSKTFKFLEEGKHYFHVRFINDKGAGPILHYLLFIDLTPPKEFSVKFLNGLDGSSYGTSDPRPRLNFATTDDLSGIDRYEIKIDEENWVNAADLISDTNIYTLLKQKPGHHMIIVRAFDKAGNFIDANATLIIEPITLPVITYYPKHIISPGQKLVVEGAASPGANVEIKLNRKRDNEPLLLSANANDSGKWAVVYEEIIPSGTYSITAKQILKNGAESLETEPVYVRVNSLLWRLWQWFKNVGGFLLILIIFLALSAVLAYYYWHKFKLFRMHLRQEAKEAEETLKSGIRRVRKEIESGVDRQKVSKDLQEVAKEVEKEIEDIEKDTKNKKF